MSEHIQDWDEFVEASPYGTVFSTSKWLSLFPNHYTFYGKHARIAGYVQDDGLKSGATPLNQFQGVLVPPLSGKYITQLGQVEQAVEEISLAFRKAVIYSHYDLLSIRPFLWNGWHVDGIRYTYILNPSWEELSKDTRYEINHCDCDFHSGIMSDFAPLYIETFKRKGMEPPVVESWLYKFDEVMHPEIYLASDSNGVKAGVCLIRDTKRAYYIFGASTGEGASSFCLWNAIKGEKEVDFVGCNDRKIDCFKRGFGGILKPYFGVAI